MNASNKKLGAFAGFMALAVGVGIATTQMTGCDEAKKACGLECPTDAKGKAFGVVEGNASISGFAPIDGFFQSVVNFKQVATGVSADIQAEINGIALAVGLDPTKLMANADVGAAVAAKIKADFKATLKVKAQPPKCEIDAKVTATVSAECQAKAGCDIDPGKASVSCMGSCEVEASASGSCEANADVECVVSGPSVACQGECKGSCTAQLDVAASCEGTCNGDCSGTCEGNTASGGKCNGTCTGMCKGSCEASGSAALNCKGSCNGSCEYKPAMAKCEASAKVQCEVKAEAKAQCQGRCDGEFEPPKANCEASASCDASAKADAKFNASCTPPSIDIDFALDAGASLDATAQARFNFVLDELKLRLPRLLAALKKGSLVADAGAKLASDGQVAIQGTIDALAGGNVDVVAGFRIIECVPAQLKAVPTVISDASAQLKTSFCAGFSLGSGLGGMTGVDNGLCK